MSHRFTIGGRPVILVNAPLAVPPPWTASRMWRLAKAKDNGGAWYVAKSRRTPKDLERLFRQREVASILEETVGGIIGGFDVLPKGVVHIQVKCDSPRDLDLVLVCLDDLGIQIEKFLPQGNMEVLNDESE